MPKSIEEMDVFKLAHSLTLKVYLVTKNFPKDEMYSLTSQVRRASSSVPANLVEGANRNSSTDYRRFVSISKGSAAEARYHLMLAKDLGYLKPKDYEELVAGYSRVLIMLEKLLVSLDK